MNAHTGATYALGEPVATYLDMAQRTGVEVNYMAAEKRAGGFLSPDERDAVAAVRAGEPVVSISPQVAQQLQLGRRELERRKRRRRAARTSRKRNR